MEYWLDFSERKQTSTYFVDQHLVSGDLRDPLSHRLDEQHGLYRDDGEQVEQSPLHWITFLLSKMMNGKLILEATSANLF